MRPRSLPHAFLAPVRLAVAVASAILAACAGPASAQTTFCADDPPLNPWLADSPYPVYHRNSYAQASTCLPGPRPGDSLAVTYRRDVTGGTSPWVYLSEAYPDGRRALLYSNSTHVFKFLDEGERLVAVDSVRLDFNTLNSNGYNHLLSRGNVWYSYEPTYEPERGRYSRLFKFGDADPRDPYSPIVTLDTFDFGDYGINRVNMYNLNYEGQIVWYSEEDTTRDVAFAGVIDRDFRLLDTLSFARLPDERINHNSIAVDEDNAFYIVTSHRLIQFAWDGEDVRIGWEARYDFVADGPTGSFAYGSGTTPTLVGWGEGNDQLVVVADGHARNNLVAFWRKPPPGWTGLPGMPLHFADSIAIPNARSFSNRFQSIKNSPTARGYGVAIAQYNGFLGYGCDNEKGVSKFRWDTAANRLELAWTNEDVNVNGVLSYSAGTGLVYGAGKELDCRYYYYGLDWDDGSVALREPIGEEEAFPDDPLYDQGVNHVIAEDGSIYYSGSRSLVRVRGVPRASATATMTGGPALRLSPSPATTWAAVSDAALEGARYDVYAADGRRVGAGRVRGGRIDLAGLPSGVLAVTLDGERGRVRVRVVKAEP